MEGSKLPTIRIGGREIPLFYSSYEMVEIQKEIGCTAFELNDAVFGILREDEDNPDSVTFGVLRDMEKLAKLGKLIRILGNAGLEENGEAPDLTDKWVMRHIKPGMIMVYVIAIVGIISDGNRIESVVKEEEKGPVDEGLEEQEAKKQPGN